MSNECDRFRKMVEASQDLFWEFDENAFFTYVSSSARDLLGYEPAELIGLNAFDLMTPDEAERVHLYFDPIAKKHLPFKSLVNINVNKNGHEVVIESSGTPIFSGEGKFLGYRGIDRDITERKLNENKLLESESRYRSFFQNNHFVMFLIDPETATIVDANPSACHYYGYDKETLLHMKITDINQLTEQQVFAEMASARKEKRQYFNFKHRLASGDIREVEVYSSPIQVQGQPLLFSMIYDITKRKQTEKSLQDSEAKLNSILRSAPIGIGQVTNREINFVNDQFAQMLGYSEQELIGNYSRIVYSSDEEFEQIGRYKYEEIKKKGTGSIETVLQKKDGTLIDVFLSSTPVNQDDLSQGVTFSALDITERKHAEEALRKSEAHLQSAFRAAPIGVGVVVDRMFKQVNKRMCEITGYSNEELVGQNARMLYLCDDDYEHVGREKYRQIRDFGTGTVETHWKCKAGHIIDVLLSSTPIDMDGPSEEVVFTALDITERKQVEEELIKHREQLELLVEDRTRELEEAQSEVIQSERLATLGRLTATVSHELRNPLGTIQSSLFSIDDSIEQNEPHRARHSLELAERSINRCVNIIEELNSYARVKKLDVSKVSVDDWLKAVFEEQSIPEGISSSLDLASGVEATFDQEKLRQAVVNIITNAVHALQDKETERKHLRISTCLLDGKYEIRFEDSGVGMPDDVKERLFEPLFSTKGFGVGLGMAIVKNIVEKHHGKINIESKKGKGTTVILRLPINLQNDRKVS